MGARRYQSAAGHSHNRKSMRGRSQHSPFPFLAAALLFALLVGNGTGFAQTPPGTRILNEAKGAFRYKTGMTDSVRSNVTATLIQSFNSIASSVDINVSPSAIVGNGRDTAMVTVAVLDGSGNSVADGVLVSLVATSGTFPGGKDSIHLPTVNGSVTVAVTSALVSQQIITAVITATTQGADHQLLSDQSTVMYFPGALKGSVVSGPTGRPVAGALAVARNESQVEEGRDTTGSDGKYLIPIHAAGLYTNTISCQNRFGDQVQASFRQDFPIPAQGGIAPIGPLNAISGSVIDRANGNPIRQAGIHVSLRPSGISLAAAGRSLPAFQTTDARGLFQFDSLNPGVYEIRVDEPGYAGTMIVHDTLENSFMIDVGLGIADVPAFEVVKSVNRRIVEIGDAVSYMIEIRNASPATPLTNIRIVDELPLGFVYAPGTSRYEQAHVPDPSGSGKIEWTLSDTLGAGKSARLTYMATVGSGAMDGDGINHAYGLADNLAGDTIQSAVTSAGVVVRPGIFTDHGIVIGKVFFDELEDGVQEYAEPGIAGVELWMEDGTHIITGQDGKYSLPDVKPGQHVIRIDRRTLPAGSTPLAMQSESAGDGSTRFIRLVDGGVARADFHIRPPQQASLQMTVAPDRDSGQPRASFVIRCAAAPMPSAIALVDTLPLGLMYDLGSLRLNGSPLPGYTGHSRSLRVEFPSRPAPSPRRDGEGYIDSVKVNIIRDSTFMKRVGVVRPKLIVSYPHRRDAVFGTVETFALHGSPVLGSASPGEMGKNALRGKEQETHTGSR